MAEIDPKIPVWPLWLEPEHISEPTLQRAVTDSPAPLAGAPQSVASTAGTWQFQLIDLPIFSDGGPASLMLGDRVSQWRSLYNGALGNGLPIYMRFFDYPRGPRARAGLSWFGPTSTHSDGSKFSDGSVYEQGTGDAVVAAAAAAGASVLSADILSSVNAQPGDLFMVGDRMHQIVGIWPDEAVAARFTWNFVPILRAPLAVGDVIELADPLCRMVLKPQDRSQIIRKERGLIGRQTLTFIEAPWE